MAGKWIWFANFELFFSSIFFWRLLRNTFVLSFYSILFGFPIPILFALALNGIRTPYYKRFVQSASYLPHFISTVIVVGMMVNFLSPVNGVVNQIIKSFGGAPLHFFNSARWFRPLYVGSEVWPELRLGIDHLPGGADRHQPGAVRSGHRRRRLALAADVAHRSAGHPADHHDPADPADGRHSGRRIREDHPHVQTRPPTRSPTSSRPTCTAGACCRPT